MKTDHPLLGKLVRYYRNGYRYGHLLATKKALARVKPVGAYGTDPNCVWVPLDCVEEAK